MFYQGLLLFPRARLRRDRVKLSSTLSFSFSLMSGGRRQTFDRRLSCEPGVWPPGHPHHVEEKRMDFLFGLVVLTTPFLLNTRCLQVMLFILAFVWRAKDTFVNRDASLTSFHHRNSKKTEHVLLCWSNNNSVLLLSFLEWSCFIWTMNLSWPSALCCWHDDDGDVVVARCSRGWKSRLSCGYSSSFLPKDLKASND